MSDRRPYTAEIGMDALVVRADGSSINFGDAIYHPENVAEAEAYAARSALEASAAPTRDGQQCAFPYTDCVALRPASAVPTLPSIAHVEDDATLAAWDAAAKARASAVPTCRECGQAKDAPDHDWQKLVSGDTQPFSVHVFFPASAVPEPTDHDVERLARAIHEAEVGHRWHRRITVRHDEYDREKAREIAAEYARLAATPPGPHTEETA